MLITSNAERTSSSARSLDALSSLYAASPRHVGMSLVFPVFVSCRNSGQDLTHGYNEEFSGKRAAYSAQVTINSPSVTSFISAGSGKVRYACYGDATPEPLYFELVRSRFASAAETLELSPCQGWTVEADRPAQDILRVLDSLRSVVAAIRSRSPIQLSAEVERLIDQAAQAHGTPEDVTAWAQRLARDVRDLTD